MSAVSVPGPHFPCGTFGVVGYGKLVPNDDIWARNRPCKAKSKLYDRGRKEYVRLFVRYWDPTTQAWEDIPGPRGPTHFHWVLKPCQREASAGMLVCVTHGAKTPQAIRKRDRRLRREKALSLVADLLDECEIHDEDPVEGLLEAVRRCGAMMRLLGELTGELETNAGDLEEGSIGGAKYLWGWDHLGDQAPNVLVQLYGQWTDRYARACKLAVDANISEELVRIADRESTHMLDAFVRAVRSVGLDHKQQEQLRLALARELRLGEALGALPAPAELEA